MTVLVADGPVPAVPTPVIHCGHSAGEAARERVIMLEPSNKGLIGTTLRYPYEIREVKDYFDDIPEVVHEPEMLKLAEQILTSKATDFDPSQFEDRYEQAVIGLLKKKQAGIPTPRERTAPQPQNVVNIMDALRQSVAQEKAASTPPKKSPKRIAGRGEMLLPIAGKARTLAAAKPAGRSSTEEKHVG
jgi:DNA end-binding protein Ku